MTNSNHSTDEKWIHSFALTIQAIEFHVYFPYWFHFRNRLRIYSRLNLEDMNLCIYSFATAIFESVQRSLSVGFV